MRVRSASTVTVTAAGGCRKTAREDGSAEDTIVIRVTRTGPSHRLRIHLASAHADRT